MQPPPRKVKPSVALKNIHADQVSKLQAKHQQECDLLEDIRTFFLRKSALEKEYAQGLQKVTSQLLKREFPAQPDLTSEDGREHNLGDGRTVCTVWRSFLEEAERLAKARLQAAEVYAEKAAEPLKPAKIGKVQCMKKVLPQFNQIQTEVSQCVMDMVKSNKIYTTEGGVAHEARQKSSEAEDKLKRKSTGIFQSLASLQKSCAKLRSRTEASEVKETAARNEYLLNLAAANAHHIRYYGTDLPEIMKTMDCDIYEKIQESLTVGGQTAAEIAEAESTSFNTIATEAAKICRQFSLQCYLFQNPVFTNLVQYQFDPCHEDTCNKVSGEHGLSPELEKEARKWSTKSAKETRAIRDYYRQLTILQNLKSGEKSSDSGSQENTTADPEVKREELRQNIRKAETAKLKAEARLESLRAGGVNVDEWINQAQMESLAAEESGLARTPSQLSLRTESSGGQSVDDHEPTYTHYDEDDDFIDDTFNTTGISQRTGTSYPVFCKALYDFEASNYDEMSIKAGEDIQLIADGDGEGWVKAKNSLGQEGYIPETYVDQGSVSNAATPVAVETMNAINNNLSEATPAPAHTPTPTSTPAPVQPPANPASPPDLQSPTSVDFQQDTTSSYSSGDLEVQQTTEVMKPDGQAALQAPIILTPSETIWARALYDYEGQTDEELTFTEGAIIKIIRKDDNGVDDGFWEGECNGSVGVFPSLVVEEIGSSATPTDPTSPGANNIPPPVHVTLPTPDGEPPPPPPMTNGEATSLNSDLDEPLPPPPLVFEEVEQFESAEDSQSPAPPPPLSTVDQTQPKRVRFITDSHYNPAKIDPSRLKGEQNHVSERSHNANVTATATTTSTSTPSRPVTQISPPQAQTKPLQQQQHQQQQHQRLPPPPQQQQHHHNHVQQKSSKADSSSPRPPCLQRPPVSPLSRHKSLPNCNNASHSQKESPSLDRSRSSVLPTNDSISFSSTTSTSNSRQNSEADLLHKQSSLPSSPQNPINQRQYLQFLDVSLAKHSRSLEAVSPTQLNDSDSPTSATTKLYQSSSQGSVDKFGNEERTYHQQKFANHMSQSPYLSNSYEQLAVDFDPLKKKTNQIPRLQPPTSSAKKKTHQNAVQHNNIHQALNHHQPFPQQHQQHHRHHHQQQQQQQLYQHRQALQHHQVPHHQQAHPAMSSNQPQKESMKLALPRGDKVPLWSNLKRPEWDSDEEGEESLV